MSYMYPILSYPILSYPILARQQASLLNNLKVHVTRIFSI